VASWPGTCVLDSWLTTLLTVDDEADRRIVL